MSTMKRAVAAAALALAGLASTAHAVTVDELKQNGPYAIASQNLPAAGFGRGTVHAPTTPGKYPLIAVCPGFVSGESTITDLSKRLATHGFVVVTIGTTTLFDFPTSRANQLLAALKAAAAVTTGNAAGKIDTSRQAVAGWSMGGGGALEAASTTPALKAVVAYAPWNLSSTKYRTLTVPAAIIGAENDAIAPSNSHSIPFYEAIPTSTPKLLGIVKGASHFFPNNITEPTSYTNIAWFKRFATPDTAYGSILTQSATDAGWSSFKSSGF